MKKVDFANPNNIIHIGNICPDTLHVEKITGVNEHLHPFWELVIYYDGDGVGKIGDREYNFVPGTAVAIPPGMPHSEKSETGYRDYHIFFAMLVSEESTIVAHDDTGAIIKLAEAMYSVYSQKGHDYIGLANSIAFSIYEFIKALGDEYKVSEHTAFFTKLIRDNVSNSAFDIADEARKYGISTHHLRYNFERDLGKTPLEYLTEQRMERARQLIISDRMRIKDISIHCGYQDSYYFSRCFKKYYGISPDYFRMSLEKHQDALGGYHTEWRK